MRIASAFVVLLSVGSALAQSCPQGTARIVTNYGSYCGAPQPVTAETSDVNSAQRASATQGTQSCPNETVRITTAYGSYCGAPQQESTQHETIEHKPAQQSSGTSAAQTCPQETVRIVTAYGSYCGTPQSSAAMSALSNQDILDLVKAGIGADVISAKIKASTCSFDTSPAALKSLKDANVPDPVILIMVQAPVAHISANAPTPVNSASSSGSSGVAR